MIICVNQRGQTVTGPQIAVSYNRTPLQRHIKYQTRQKQLNQQYSNRVKRCDHGAFARLHQPPQCTCRDVNPCRANKLPVGRSNRIGHAVTNDVRLNQHLSVDMNRTTINDAVDLPAIVATTLFGAKR